MSEPPMMPPMAEGFEVEDTTIYFYGEIRDERIMQLSKTIDILEFQILAHQLKYRLKEVQPIVLKIKSPGGEIFAGLAGYNAIKNCRVPIHIYVEGFAASAATLLLAAGKRRVMSRHSFLMIHQLIKYVIWNV
jgi:ATP-dependent protease ClpP protease subunit